MELEKNKELIAKFNDVQEEILKIGWQGILERYHPDVNCDEPDTQEIFKMYRAIYQNMKGRLIAQ